MKKLLSTLILLSVALPLQAQAYEVLHQREKIPAISGVTIDSQAATKGQDFQATLSEAVHYRGDAMPYRVTALPEGTQFIGHISDTTVNSKFWSRGRYVDVWIDKVVFPTGKSYAIYPGEKIKKPHLRLYNRFKHGSNHQVGGNYEVLHAGDMVHLQFTPHTLRGLMETGGEEVRR